EIVDLLGLNDQVGRGYRLARIQTFPSLPLGAVANRSINLTSPAVLPVKFAGTVTLTPSPQRQSNMVTVQINSGRVYWNPPPYVTVTSLHLENIAFNWCLANSKGVGDASGPVQWGIVLFNLDEQISAQREIDLEGYVADLSLPLDDPKLERHWLCLRM